MALVAPEQDPGVVGGRELLDFAEALLGTDRARLDRARDAVAQVLGREAIGGVAAVAATFSMNDRIANACGIPVEPMVLNTTKDLRQTMGLNQYRISAYKFKHFQDE